MNEQNAKKNESSLTFVDIFAGCGGLSLGLMQSGWKGVFAIEKDSDAFETLKSNLSSGGNFSFDWPENLPHQHQTTSDLLTNHRHILESLKGGIDLLAGGPPCQGFSIAGRRTEADPRNKLFEEYLEVVSVLEPRFLILENVKGFTLPFIKNGSQVANAKPYSVLLREKLEQIGYITFSEVVCLNEFGVPQNRKRFILIAVKQDDSMVKSLRGLSPFHYLNAQRESFLQKKGFPTQQALSVQQAIGDLETQNKKLIDNIDSPVKGFKQIQYTSERYSSKFIELMRQGFSEAPNSLRLAKHRKSTIEKFTKILETCEKGKSITNEDRKRLGIKKFSTTPLCPNCPSVTVTTLPDDMIHYSEPRILTVREMARLQSFPDWFAFQGKYTTGGKRRKQECPRYTQVGNAVPPLFAEALGGTLKDLALREKTNT